MNRDGTKDGYDIPITKAISESIDLPIIASGGAGTAEHIYAGFVDGKADACLAASIFHFKEVSIASFEAGISLAHRILSGCSGLTPASRGA